MLDLAVYAFGDTYSISESLVKATPILFCALAVILPARLGLISVGADGQLYLGALVGTGVVLAMPERADPSPAAGHADRRRDRRRGPRAGRGRTARPLRGQRDDHHAAPQLCRGAAGQLRRLRAVEGPRQSRLAGDDHLSGGGDGARPVRHPGACRADPRDSVRRGPACRFRARPDRASPPRPARQRARRPHGRPQLRPHGAADHGDRRRASPASPASSRPRRSRAGCSRASRSATG